MSERQRKFIEQAAKERHLFWADVEEIAFRSFGVTTKELSHEQARRLCQLVLHQPKPEVQS